MVKVPVISFVLDKTSTGDAIVAALAVISAMTGTGQQLSALKQAFKKYPQHMVNVRCDDKTHIEHSSVKQAVAAVESKLGDQGRVLLRPSAPNRSSASWSKGCTEISLKKARKLLRRAYLGSFTKRKADDGHN